MNDNLHIVCLDAPAPPDYGGVIDMFYKIKALAAIGKKITLHYFNYNAARNTKGLENECIAIYAYDRKSFPRSLPIFQPHIVRSRINHSLIERLNKDDNPILLEGLHCAGIIPFLVNPKRVLVRMHNEEAAYYRHLFKTESFLLKKFYFNRESKLLEQYVEKMNKELTLACLSTNDLHTFQSQFRFQHVHFVPCFIPWQKVGSVAGSGNNCLYHGNLSVSENAEAAHWLIENVFKHIVVPLTIAGKGMPASLIKLAKMYSHIRCVNNPSITEIDRLVQQAHINVLPSLNATGVKLKLLNALLNGRFCMTNTAGVMGSNLDKFVLLPNNNDEWKSTILSLMTQEFSQKMIVERREVLATYNNVFNAQTLSELW